MSDNLTDMELMRLYECSVSSRYGIPDQGSPGAYLKLRGLGLLEQVGNGHVITTLGLETLKLNKGKLFGQKKRAKKPKKSYDDDSDFSED